MVLEIFLKQKKVVINGRKVPLNQVKIGTKDGNGYLFAGDVSDVAKRSEKLDKETVKAVRELHELEHKRIAIEKSIKTAKRKVANAEKKQKQWDAIA